MICIHDAVHQNVDNIETAL